MAPHEQPDRFEQPLPRNRLEGRCGLAADLGCSRGPVGRPSAKDCPRVLHGGHRRRPVQDDPSLDRLLHELHPFWYGECMRARGRGNPSADMLWAFLDQLTRDEAAAVVVSRVLPDSVLTISYSSSVARAIELGRPARTLCMRSDPGGEGERMADVVSAWTKAEVVDDERALAEVRAGAVITGADAITPSAVVNKVKTRILAVAAGRHGIPCYAVAGRMKLVDRELPVIGPFEPTPLELFTGVGLPDGLRSPQEAAAEAMAASLHPALLPLLDASGRA